MVGSALSSKTTAQLSGGEKIKGKSPTVVYSTVSTGKLAGQNRRVLPVLRYPINMVIYHYLLIGVIFMVNFSFLLSKITQISSQNITLNSQFR